MNPRGLGGFSVEVFQHKTELLLKQLVDSTLKSFKTSLIMYHSEMPRLLFSVSHHSLLNTWELFVKFVITEQ